MILISIINLKTLFHHEIIMAWEQLWHQIDIQAGWTFLSKGGVLMYPLFVCSVLVIAIAMERWLRLRQARTQAETLYGVAERIVNEQDADSAYQHLRVHSGPLAAVLRVLLLSFSQDKGDLEEVALMQARRELRGLNARLPTLGLIAGLAPLIGLMGTVVGMVKAFQQVATIEGAVNPSHLAGGIWEALLTTVAGLAVAIPALIIHHVFDQRVKRYAFEMDYYGSALIRLLSRSESLNA